ncbi:ABC transporter substrate-binding protein [Aeromicrobium sp. P5_D10]
MENDQLVTTPAGKGTLSKVTWNLPTGEPNSIAPTQSTSNNNIPIVSNTCDALLRINAKYEIEPGLAESWKYSKDHLTLTYTLRSGVKFWDGQPLTSADVAYSLGQNLDPKVASLNGTIFTNVKSVEADGPERVVVRFKAPDELFHQEMAIVPGMISQKAYVEADPDAYGSPSRGLMCSGPYKLEKWNSGSEMILKANDDYWDKTKRPKVETVRVKFITDVGTLTQGFKSGEIDGAFGFSPTLVPSLKSVARGKVYLGKSPRIAILLATGGPGADPEIRKALSMIIDRQSIAEKIYFNAARPSYALMTPAWWQAEAKDIYEDAYNALILPRKPDPSGAKKVIGGNANASKPIVIAALQGNEAHLRALTLIQEDAKKIGLDVEIRAVTSSVYSKLASSPAYRESSDVSFFWADTMSATDPLDNLLYTVLPRALGGTGQYVDYDGQDEVGTLLQQARATFDARERAKLIVEGQKIWEDEQNLVIPVVALSNTLFMNKRISGAPAAYSGIYMPSLAMLGGTD